MNNPNQLRNKNRRNFVLLVVVFLMPMIVAWLVLKNIDTLKPSGSRNFGELIQPARPLQEFTLQLRDGVKFGLDEVRGKWNIFYFNKSECAQTCQETFTKLHQARLGQGREMHRLRFLYVNTDSATVTEQTLQFIKSLPETKIISGTQEELIKLEAQFEATGKSPKEEGRFFLIDPNGNIMMTYSKESFVRDLLKDLDHLLKYSQIG